MDSNQPFESPEASKNHRAADCAPIEGGSRQHLECVCVLSRQGKCRPSSSSRPLIALQRLADQRRCDVGSNRVQGDKLFLFTAKTGTAVYCPLPPVVINALNEIPGSTYYFWTGLSKPKSVVGDWQRSLKRLFRLAGVPDAHAHRFRDTFSVELLLAGVPIERVSILLGHQSVRITEKHYAPWVRARQEQLEADVRRTWPEEV